MLHFIPFLSFHKMCNIAKPVMGQKDLLFSSFVSFDSLFKSAVELSVSAGTLFSSPLAETTGSSAEDSGRLLSSGLCVRLTPPTLTPTCNMFFAASLSSYLSF